MTVGEFNRERTRALLRVRDACGVLEAEARRLGDIGTDVDDIRYWVEAALEDVTEYMGTIEQIENVGL